MPLKLGQSTGFLSFALSRRGMKLDVTIAQLDRIERYLKERSPAERAVSTCSHSSPNPEMPIIFSRSLQTLSSCFEACFCLPNSNVQTVRSGIPHDYVVQSVPPWEVLDPSCVTGSPTLTGCTQAAGPPSPPLPHTSAAQQTSPIWARADFSPSVERINTLNQC